eukprot:CAMPEP_0171942634 /NCGR_PEP_ID=MMETSP0993-20121228/38819_1 /TAXON_ID=483369 /ORGANISM="non described non described, Strain CCMP2098" /LENGTH=493 /DNA_ID=CAMNT_0012585099 /DNA_START=18 /DNA_END=1499 /DNA_ORIENTATION=+
MLRFFNSAPSSPPPLKIPREGYRELRGVGLATVHVVGGAHLSEESARQATDFITALRPHEVLLELCDQRRSMLDPSLDKPTPPLLPFTEFAWKNPWTVANPLFWIMQLPLLGFEALTDVPMGGEMRAAFRAAQSCGSHVYLIDRPVGITLFRAVGAAVAAADASMFGGGGDSDKSSSSSSSSSSGSDDVDNSNGDEEEAAERSGSLQVAPAVGSDSRSGLDTAWGLYSGVVRAHDMPEEEFQELRREAKQLIQQMLETVEGGGVSASFGALEGAAFHAIGFERDRLLAFECHKAATRAFQLHGTNAQVVAVVGAAHSKGMANEWRALTHSTPKEEGNGPPADGGEAAAAAAEAAVVVLPSRGEPRLLPNGTLSEVDDSRRPGSFVYSESYLDSIEALYDVEEPRQKIQLFCAKALALDGAALVAGYAAFRVAKQRGGGLERGLVLMRRASIALSVGTFAVGCAGMGLGFNGVRSLQGRRVRDHQRREAVAAAS